LKAINRASFFEHLRGRLYRNGPDRSQITGHEAILDAWLGSHADGDERWLAYVLATAHHETGSKMQPVCENLNYSASGLIATFPRYFSAADARRYARRPREIANRAYAGRLGNGSEGSGDGWRYRGRGLVQITGRANYGRYDLIDDPDRALSPTIAVRILFDGMIRGVFTGKKLADFFNDTVCDWTGARSIVNPGDRADLIAANARAYYRAIGRSVGDRSGRVP
jgi:putative chitinase